MGVTAENVAERFDISREDQDQMALQSHRRAQTAIEKGYFKDQIIPIDMGKRGKVLNFEQDEHVRFDASLEDLQKLRPAFQKDGTVTAGNASGINDAAAALVLMDAESAKTKGIASIGELIDYTIVGVSPDVMGIGPVPAISTLLERNSLSVNDIDVYEVNEAFAAQAAAVVKELGLPIEKVNPNGSGISLGHPVGATGAIVTVKALHELQRIMGRYAVVSLCIGGGQGIAVLIKNNNLN
jgi:acetyl-CoA C-acetyltransferase